MTLPKSQPRTSQERLGMARETSEPTRLVFLMDECSGVLCRAQTVASGLQDCAERILHNLDASLVNLWLLDESGDFLDLRGSAGMLEDAESLRTRVGEGIAGEIVRTGQPGWSNSLVNPPASACSGHLVMVEERVAGVVTVFAHHPFSDAAVTALGSVARGVGQFVGRKRAEEALADREES
jgi:hypothetical protein